ncbi:T9SS type A sorting domain-containing protein [Flavihumibacter sp. CACIAM 22H1]|uniref:T9SS type A sorting domain-containing protein n=1 Tax=Flavihumibacter sp. CACIAM 22H1 TaxID=1812911 RepID=UPI0007A9224E|nr:T9SS type A sorting domain-containing protein [Flavihumibacter sp. CACIAM 22H1]KYP15699.1 MAG: hypothetical protein A1D16_19240 [Flavihumibacter sp. CACIAM 22H1]
MRRLVHLSILLLFLSVSGYAQSKYWVAPGASGNWSNAANWSLTSGGAGGAGAPIAGQIAVFNGASLANCQLDLPSITVTALTVAAGYTGTISPAGTTNMTIRFDVNISSGTVILPAVSSVGGIYTQNGGTFTTGATSGSFANIVNINNGTLNVNGTVSFANNINIPTAAGVLNTGTSTVVLEGTGGTLINNNGAAPGTTTFYNLTINKTSAVANAVAFGTADQVIVQNDLTLIDGAIAASTGNLQVGRNLTIGAAFNGAFTNLTLNGAADAVVTVDAPFINANSGSTTINKANPGSQVSFVTNLPTNLINFSTLTTNTLNITQGTVNFPTDNNVIWNFNAFNIGANATVSASANTMTFQGSFHNFGTFTANNGTVAFVSGTNRSYSVGTSLQNGTTTFYNVILNNTNADGSFNIELGDRLAAANDLTVVSGYFNAIGGSLTNQSYLSVGGALTLQSAAKAMPLGIHLEFIGANPQSVNLAAGTTSHINGNISLLKTAPGPITFNSAMVLDVVGQQMQFTGGVLVTSLTNILNFATNGVVALGGNTGSYVDGPISRTGFTAFTFPTGDGEFFGPIHISGGGFNANIPSATYLAQYFHVNPDGSFPIDQQSPTNPPDLKVSEVEYWSLDQTSGTPVPGPRVWLSFESVRSGGITDPTTIGVTAWTNPGFWQLVGNGGLQNVGGIDYVSSANTNNFTVTQASPVFTLSTIDEVANPLPVTWLSFTGRYSNGAVDLNWSTSLELNNEEYTIERSADGHNFSSIGTVAGVGNTTNISRYSFKDTNPLAGSGYYRIKQTDRDGKFSYSDIIRVSNGEVALKGLRIFPNPISGNVPLTIENGNWKNKKVTVTIYNAIGGIVRQEQLVFGADSRAKINVDALQKGSYFITTSINSEKQTLQFFIQ